MAQTKRKRRTKHRGNAAGVVESRGRTGRKTSSAPKTKEEKRAASREARAARFDRPPTWKGALTRAAIATVLFFVVVVLLFRQPIQSAGALAAFMLVVYVPLGYYTDMFFYRRRQRQKLMAKQGGQGAGKGAAPDKGARRNGSKADAKDG
jgi:hypothetical protein